MLGGMDWSKIIAALQESGMSQQQIADEIGSSQSYVSELLSGRKGKRLDYRIGSRLQSLWMLRCQSRPTATDPVAAATA